MAPHRFRLGLAAALLTGTWIVACGGDDTPGGIDPGVDGGSDNARESGAGDEDTTDSGRNDSGPKDAGSDTKEPKDAGPDVWGLPPGTILDLVATAESHVSAKLTWTSPPGTTAQYEIRYAATPITTEAEFLAATVATTAAPPTPLPTGTQQTATVTGLTPETTYHFVVRVKNAQDADADGAYGPLSNDAVVTTSGRARLLVSEIAPSNTAAQGGDFIELVVTKAGSIAGLKVVAHAEQPAIHTFAALDVAVGDRIVMHASGLPGPSGFAQEDETRNKTSSTAANASAGAYDVYMAMADLPKRAAITILDGDDIMDPNIYMDAVPYATREAPIVAPAPGADADQTEFNAAFFQTLYASVFGGIWPLSAADPLNDYQTTCSFYADIVNASGNESLACGGFPGWVIPGWSLQRNGVVDTNTPADFVSAPQTRGAANAPYCGAETAKLVVSEVNPRAGLVELNVVQGGRLRAFELRTNPQDQTGAGAGANLVTLPDVCGATGDVVVVHLGTNATPNETTAKNQHLHATYPAYYDGAWDFVTSSTLTFASSVVVAIRNPASVFVDAAAFSDRTTATTGDYVASLRYAQEKGLWLPADCGGALCGGGTTPTAREVAASWSSLDATTGTSVKRTGVAVPSQASLWSSGASSFGQ
jgi:Fibronectin type III domain